MRMSHLVLLSGLSSSEEAAEPVPFVVQTAPSDSIELIGFAIIALLFILILLTITLICMEVRQSTMYKRFHFISKRLERTERPASMSAPKDSFAAAVCGPATTTVDYRPATTTVDYRPATTTVDYRPATTTIDYRPERSTPPPQVVVEELSDAPSNRAITHAKSEAGAHSAAPPVVAPQPLCGLRVAASSHYNHSRPVGLNEIPAQDAVFILYSDMTVLPDNKLFNGANKPGYYTNNDFTMLFDFRDSDGNPLTIHLQQASIKCLKVARGAVVHHSNNEYLLLRKGILIAEEC